MTVPSTERSQLWNETSACPPKASIHSPGLFVNHGLRDPVAREYKFVITLASPLCAMYCNLYSYPVLELSRQGSSFDEGCEGHTKKETSWTPPSRPLSPAPSLPHLIPAPPFRRRQHTWPSFNVICIQWWDAIGQSHLRSERKIEEGSSVLMKAAPHYFTTQTRPLFYHFPPAEGGSIEFSSSRLEFTWRIQIQSLEQLSRCPVPVRADHDDASFPTMSRQIDFNQDTARPYQAAHDMTSLPGHLRPGPAALL
ncbi:uncharacterized protein CLUP02_00228 [Colletotrichum lupini]|uniref:Uncharacterized protein n=1 Tax=Colletotrichum lupini TaxID=145971 RepID=A0A9Q8W6N9_9PEZI|nr:uncharacterized protein CLUP02_00228 [Colletotrichum lupini]UQC73583.1 hypothetical protein CLUP02_00228 [Colletotrichum lupini]